MRQQRFSFVSENRSQCGRIGGPPASELGVPMRAALHVAVAQPLCVPYDVTQNAVAHVAAVRAAAARVVVFPEMSLTGYELGAPALTASDPRLCRGRGVRRDGVGRAGWRAGPGGGRTPAHRGAGRGRGRDQRGLPQAVAGRRRGRAVCPRRQARRAGGGRLAAGPGHLQGRQRPAAPGGHGRPRRRRLRGRDRHVRRRAGPPGRAGQRDRGPARHVGRDRQLRGLGRRCDLRVRLRSGLWVARRGCTGLQAGAEPGAIVSALLGCSTRARSLSSIPRPRVRVT